MARLRRLLEILTACGIAIYLAVLLVRPHLSPNARPGRTEIRQASPHTASWGTHDDRELPAQTSVGTAKMETAAGARETTPGAGQTTTAGPGPLRHESRIPAVEDRDLPRPEAVLSQSGGPGASPSRSDWSLPPANDGPRSILLTTYTTGEAPAPPELLAQPATGTSPSFEVLAAEPRPSPPQANAEGAIPSLRISLQSPDSSGVVSGSQNSGVRAETIPTPAPLASPELPLQPAVTQQELGSSPIQIELRDADIRDAIHTLARQAGLNVLISNSVQGKLSLSLDRITPAEALRAVIRAAGYISLQDDNLLYIGTAQEIKNLEQLSDQVGTRIYRPNYVPAKELESLLKPLVTPQIGLVTVSSAAEKGIAPNPADAGGDAYAGSDVVIVRDYEKVLREIDHIVTQIDTRPPQVAIEAMIISVNIDDKNHFGISFELLRDKGYVKFGWGFVPQDLDGVKFDNSGLKFAYLDASLGAFLNALESIGDTNVIATPRLLVLNKHRAEILIGKELGYVSTTVTETSSSQTVEFLKVGAQLVIRPFISNDGLIRMEVHPEVSTGAVQITNNFTVPNKDTTQVTTNILVPNGATVIIGGLMREDLQTTSSQIPFLGNLPLVGAAFRNKIETTTKQEIIVLLTPRIVDDYHIAREGEGASQLWRRRQRVVADDMSPLSSQNAARRWVEQARVACAEGDYARARRLAELAVEFDPNNVEAIMLRDQLGTSGAALGVRNPAHGATVRH